MLTLSLIIPVYNEERHIKACLDAVARQTVMPDEVIVVDNNSSDNTVAIAQAYPFVTILRETKQGLIAARNAGFAAASSDIYGRIDADSQIEVDWVARVKAQFSVNANLSGVTGYGRTDVIPYLPWPRTSFICAMYYWYIHASIGLQVLWGANMAITASAWRDISMDACLDDTVVHEDQDISILLLAKGKKIQLDRKLIITTPGHQYGYLPKLLYYRRLHVTTKQYHQKKGTLSQAQKQRVSRMLMIVKVLISIPVVIYVWTLSVALFPIDYSLRRIMRGK